MIRAIAFDWGGVFTEGTFDDGAMRALSHDTGLPLARVREAYLPAIAAFEAGEHDLDGFRERLQGALGVAWSPDAFRRTFLDSVRDRPATYALLADLPRSYRVGMLSNNVDELCDRVRHDPRMARIDAFVFSNEIRVRKPDPAAYRALRDALDVPPAETLFVDDNDVNVAAAREQGFRALHLSDVAAFLDAFGREVPDAPLEGARAAWTGVGRA